MTPAIGDWLPPAGSGSELNPIQAEFPVSLTSPLQARKTIHGGLTRSAEMAEIGLDQVAAESASLFDGSPDALSGEAIQPQKAKKKIPVVSALKTEAAANLWPFVNDAPENPTVEEVFAPTERPELDDDPFYDSHLTVREYASTPAQRAWRTVQAFFLSRRFSQAMAVLLLMVFVSTLDVQWREWLEAQMKQARETMADAINTVTRPIRERAAFFIVDDFQDGIDNWVSNGSMTLDPGGLVRVDGMALRQDTLNLVSYRLEFDAKIERGAVGWAVRAQDMENYYAFKLVERRRRNSRSYHLRRYAVIGGSTTGEETQIEIPVPGHLPNEDDFNRISVRVRDSQVTTLINGWGIDFWKDSRLDRGGIGLFNDKGESALVSRVTVSGNDDTWGLILYGTIETIRSISDTISPRVAMVLQPVPIELYRAKLSRP